MSRPQERRRAPVVGWIGRRGSGKTDSLRSCVWAWLREFPRQVRFLIWDHTDEWGFVEGNPDAFVFSSRTTTLEEVCQMAIELEDVTVVADEVDHEVDSHSGLIRGSALHTVVNYGRHHGVGMAWACRRLAMTPHGILAASSCLFLFNQHDPHDLRITRRHVGEALAGSGKEWTDPATGKKFPSEPGTIPMLGVGEFLFWDASNPRAGLEGVAVKIEGRQKRLFSS